MLLNLLNEIRRNCFRSLMIFILLFFFLCPIPVKAVNFSALSGRNSTKNSMLANMNFNKLLQSPITRPILKSAGFAATAYLLGHLTSKCSNAADYGPCVSGEHQVDSFWVAVTVACLAATCVSLGLSALNIMPRFLLNRSSTGSIAAAKTAGFCMMGLLCGYVLKENFLNRVIKDKEPHWKRSVISFTIGGLSLALATRHAINCIELTDFNNLWELLVG